MKANKYKRFEATLKNGTTVIAKAPAARLTEKYAIISNSDNESVLAARRICEKRGINYKIAL